MLALYMQSVLTFTVFLAPKSKYAGVGPDWHVACITRAERGIEPQSRYLHLDDIEQAS